MKRLPLFNLRRSALALAPRQRTAAICGAVRFGKGARQAVFGPWGRARALLGPRTAGKAVAALYERFSAVRALD